MNEAGPKRAKLRKDNKLPDVEVSITESKKTNPIRDKPKTDAAESILEYCLENIEKPT